MILGVKSGFFKGNLEIIDLREGENPCLKRDKVLKSKRRGFMHIKWDAIAFDSLGEGAPKTLIYVG